MTKAPILLSAGPISTIEVSGKEEPIFFKAIPPQWTAAATAKGYAIVARIRDRYHMALRCNTCDDLHKTKRSVLMDSQPICQNCVDIERQRKAAIAGLVFLRRDRPDGHYGVFRADCGHDLRRQYSFIDRVYEGATGIRCEQCHLDREAGEAEARGWRLDGPDPEGDVNYRLYSHTACGNRQRIARVNMQTGRFNCSHCGTGWVTAKSEIYLMQFTLRSGEVVLKLGYSRNPHARMNNQLKSAAKQPSVLLRTIPMKSGHAALMQERALHKHLQATAPWARVPADHFRGQIKVKSEVYLERAADLIHPLLDAIEPEVSD